MAAVAGRQYGQGAVYGSLAYDFDNPELYREEYSRPRTPAAKPQTHTYSRVRTCTKVVARSRQGISPVSVLGLFVAAVMFVISITAQIALFDVSSESVALSKELAVLEEEQARLRIAYERAFNLSEVETYAKETLGMQKPSADQIFYIDTSAADKAVVIASGESDSFTERAADFLSGLHAYFK